MNEIMERLLLTPRDAAKALSVCEKTLWSLTEPRGDLPAVRQGRLVRYALDDLKGWIAKHRGTAA